MNDTHGESEIDKGLDQNHLKDNGALFHPFTLVGFLLAGLLFGYLIARQQEASRREHFLDYFGRQARNWLDEYGQKAAPLKEGVESAFAQASKLGSDYGDHFNRLTRRQKPKFLGLF